MIIFYLGSQENKRPEWLTHLSRWNVLQIGDKQKDWTMEQLAKASQDDIQDVTGEGVPFLFWVDEDSKDVTDLQKELYDAGLNGRQMAVKTEHNMSWPFSKLYDEVCQEARWFEQRDKLSDLIRAADQKRLEKEPKYQQAVFSCYALLQQEDVPLRLLDLAVEMLEKANQDI